MAGLIAATGAYGGGQGSFGLAPGAKILPIRVPDSSKANNQYGAAEQFNKVAAKAIRYAVDNDAKVINISQAVLSDSPQLTNSVDYALNKGALVFAGIGNDGASSNKVMYPAGTPGVVAVSAVGKDLHRTTESNYGPQADMAAPGDEMVHACGTKTSANALCKSHGTSDATALASASAALIWAKHPNWTNNQVLNVILNTVGGPANGDKRNDFIGYGIVRPRIALRPRATRARPTSTRSRITPSQRPSPRPPSPPRVPRARTTQTPPYRPPHPRAVQVTPFSGRGIGGIGVGAAAFTAVGISFSIAHSHRRVAPSPLGPQFPKSSTSHTRYPHANQAQVARPNYGSNSPCSGTQGPGQSSNG
ncbi:S8 family serine peptidase [Streptomyces sp. NPDC048641]|uniref:S8 family serine peptidase n=1 Tax=Streptomyces sp. NPDC048641 TaxID=3154825 RepID=UPI003429CB5C